MLLQRRGARTERVQARRVLVSSSALPVTIGGFQPRERKRRVVRARRHEVLGAGVRSELSYSRLALRNNECVEQCE